MATTEATRVSDRDWTERMRFMACAMILIFSSGWVVWFYPFDDLLDGSGTPLGADFSMFFVAGHMVIEGQGESIYDAARQQAELHALIPGIDTQFALPYRYPPFVASAMSILASLPYPVAFAFFLAFSLACWLAGIWLLTSRRHDKIEISRGTVMLVACGWPVALETLIGGQASMFAFLLVAATVTLLMRNRDGWAGAVLALAAYKPNVLLLVGVGMVLARPRMLRGAIPVAAILCVLSLIPAGWNGIAEYAGLSSRLATSTWDLDTPYWKVHGVVPLFTYIFPHYGRSVAILLGLAGSVGIAWRWRFLERTGSEPRDVIPDAVAALITINALFNPYTPIYDLTLLAAAFLLGRSYRAPTLLVTGVFYFGPHLSQAIAKPTGWQPFTLALVGLAVWQLRNFLLPQAAPGSTPYDEKPSQVPPSRDRMRAT